MNEKLNYKHHKIYFEKPEKCRRPIGATECNSKKIFEARFICKTQRSTLHTLQM